MQLTRKEILHELMRIFRENFEIDNPGTNDDLREEHEFDSIDAIELLVEIEKMVGFALTQEEKKQAMDIRTVSHVCDYIETLAASRA
ncbi:MAG: acyl carrier protein [Deltaproteobacteria bacterium]|nr:acyl carrier protein [Deltaproteobacteria bacterium]